MKVRVRLGLVYKITQGVCGWAHNTWISAWLALMPGWQEPHSDHLLWICTETTQLLIALIVLEAWLSHNSSNSICYSCPWDKINDVQSEFSPLLLPLMTFVLFLFFICKHTCYRMTAIAGCYISNISCRGKEGNLALWAGTWQNASIAETQSEKGILTSVDSWFWLVLFCLGGWWCYVNPAVGGRDVGKLPTSLFFLAELIQTKVSVQQWPQFCCFPGCLGGAQWRTLTQF